MLFPICIIYLYIQNTNYKAKLIYFLIIHNYNISDNESETQYLCYLKLFSNILCR